jgi:hypothetical protein
MKIEQSASPNSWAPEVQTDSTGKWYGNALRFATEAEAYASAAELATRWMLVRDYRAAPSADPVTVHMPDIKNPRAFVFLPAVQS